MLSLAYHDKVLLLGDAAHAMVPFYGQGMNCAFEDCTYLDACIAQHYPDWERIFQAFEQQRKEHTDAIADMAISNLIEMRDRVADPKFLLQKRLELELERKYPGVFIPQYSMVTFHRIPYAEARRKGDVQERLLEALCAPITSLDESGLGPCRPADSAKSACTLSTIRPLTERRRYQCVARRMSC
jgi:kynurenine 3-monooxygenase